MILGFLVRRRRFYLGSRRIHHGRVGAWLIAAGLLAILDDWKDRWWSWD